MPSEQHIVEVISKIEADLPGFMAASLVDLGSGMTLGVKASDPTFDLTTASAYNSEMVKQKQKIMQALKLDSTLEDMLVTLADQIHLIKLITPNTFLYLAAERSTANLAMVRLAVDRYASELE